MGSTECLDLSAAIETCVIGRKLFLAPEKHPDEQQFQTFSKQHCISERLREYNVSSVSTGSDGSASSDWQSSDFSVTPRRSVAEMWLAGTGTERFCGSIKAFYTSKGFGFIQCAETYIKFGRDVFVHESQIGTCRTGQGQIVSFSVTTNAQGQPQARDLLPVSVVEFAEDSDSEGAPTTFA